MESNLFGIASDIRRNKTENLDIRTIKCNALELFKE